MSEDPRFTGALPGALPLEAGQTVRLPLISAMGSGNTWHAEVDGSAARAAVEVSGPPRQELPGGMPPGSSSATETLVVTGIQAGAARVELVLSRSWQPDAPLARHQLAVTVTVPATEPGGPVSTGEE